MIELKENDLVFAKVHPDAKIPSKERENAGYDIYACFDEDYMVVPAHTTKLIPTGITSAMTEKWEIRLRDRGSNGSKGIHVLAGTIDSGFRNSWFVAWCNTNNENVILSKLTFDELMEKYGESVEGGLGTFHIPLDPTEPFHIQNNSLEIDALEKSYLTPILYPYSKAICQAEVCEVPVMNVREISYEKLKGIPSKRGLGSLGSSGK